MNKVKIQDNVSVDTLSLSTKNPNWGLLVKFFCEGRGSLLEMKSEN